MKKKFTLIQFNSHSEYPEENFKKGMHFLEAAVKKGTHFAMWHEHWTVETKRQGLLDQAQSYLEFLPVLQSFAKAHGIHLFSPMYRVEGEQIYNSLFVIRKDGSLATVYDKIFLFEPMFEHEFNAAGKKSINCIELDGIRFGLNICFELRFSELAHEQRLQGAEVLLYPAQWGVARQEHWLSLLQSRAIENQAYVLGSNRIGKSHFGELGGHSRAVDPWGKTLDEMQTQEGFFTVEINTEYIEEIRKKIPMRGRSKD